jgi:hypothetical protein
MLGIDIEQAASATPHAATDITRIMVAPTVKKADWPSCPQATIESKHTGASVGTQPRG